MHSSEALLTLAEVFAPKAYQLEPDLVENLVKIFKSIDNEDSNEYNAMALFCDILFANDKLVYYFKDAEGRTKIETTCAFIDDALAFPSIKIGTNSKFLCRLVKWLMNNRLINDIYKEYTDVIDVYLEEVEDETCEIGFIPWTEEVNNDDFSIRQIKNFRDMFGIISGHRCLEIYEALISCVENLRV